MNYNPVLKSQVTSTIRNKKSICTEKEVLLVLQKSIFYGDFLAAVKKTSDTRGDYIACCSASKTPYSYRIWENAERKNP